MREAAQVSKGGGLMAIYHRPGHGYVWTLPDHVEQAVEEQVARNGAQGAFAREPRSREERVLARKHTGNYRVALVDLGDTGEEFVLRVRYTGTCGGDVDADVPVRDLDEYLQDYVDEGDLERIDAAARKWFGQSVNGDLDAANYLNLGGYDQYTNRRR